jgi:hypothetical protein
MLSKTLVRAQTAIGTGVFGSGAAGDAPTLKISDAGLSTGTLQVSIVGTSASVSIWGRTSASMPWILATAAITTTSVVTVNLFTEMYAQVTAVTAATVDVGLNYVPLA